MMRPSILLSLAAACAGLVMVVSATRLRGAAERADAATVALTSAAVDARELLALRARRVTRMAGEEPAQDTLAQVTAALADSGIPSGRLKSLERDSDTELANQSSGTSPRLRTLSMRLTLEPVRVPELDAFLTHWANSQSLWSVSRLELSHSGAADEREGTFAARLIISAVYIPPSATESTPTAALPSRSGS